MNTHQLILTIDAETQKRFRKAIKNNPEISEGMHDQYYIPRRIHDKVVELYRTIYKEVAKEVMSINHTRGEV